MGKRGTRVIAEFSTVPLGTGSTSLSGYVSKAYAVVKGSGLPFTLTPMGTVLEADGLEEVLGVVAKAHEALFEAGAERVSTTIKIDDRRDKARVMGDKVRSLEGRRRQ